MSESFGSDHEATAELFKVLASPTRLAILEALTVETMCVHELVTLLAAPQSLVSQHLRVLRSARLVRGSRRGREVAYALNDDHVGHIVLDALNHAREDAS